MHEKLIACLAILLLSVAVHADEEKTLNVFNWVDFIAPDTISNFEKEFGVKVNYDLYDSTEIVEAKLLAGRTGYDVIILLVAAGVMLAALVNSKQRSTK